MGGGPPPPLPPLPPLPPTCLGVTKQQKPCAISWGLDALGFCKFHSPQASQCRGVARSTGLRCRLRWDLSTDGFCRHHAPAPRQCVAIALSTRQRCRIAVGIDAEGLCSVHRKTPRRAVASTQCQGVVHRSGEPCANAAKPGYAYCCAAHDPSLPYFSPRLFDAGDKPRALLEPLVVELYNGRDLYHGDALDLATPGLVELDHILEKQCFSYAFHGLEFADREKDVAFLASVVRDDFANQLSNLCLTRAATNKIKGAAVWKFLDDLLTGHSPAGPAAPSSFTSYMMAETRDGVRLGRNTTRVIVREMGRALKQCQYKMVDQGETPLLDALSGQMQEVFVKMDLHVAASVRAKWDADAAPRESSGDSERSQDAVDDDVSTVGSSRTSPQQEKHGSDDAPGTFISGDEYGDTQPLARLEETDTSEINQETESTEGTRGDGVTAVSETSRLEGKDTTLSPSDSTKLLDVSIS